MLHHHVESIISLCLESNSQTLLDHLFQDCNFLTKLLTADENPYAPDTTPEVHCNLKVFEYFVQCLVKCFCLPLFGFFLWLPEQVLTLLFLLHRENGDFSILMKDIFVKSY
jgi:hypothetical protein